MPSSKKYIVQLDGLRFYAVLMVMVAHWLQWQWSNKILTSFPFTHGVLLFFVLSGFLITRILLENRDKAHSSGGKTTKILKSFYARRFLRIFPLYYVVIILLFIIDYKNTHEILFWLLTYTTNIYQSIHNDFIGDFSHFWSLAVEEQFYLFWPLLILFIDRRKSLWIILATILISVLVRIFLYLFIGKWMATSYFTLSCMFILGVGALLAYFTLYCTKIILWLSSKLLLLFISVLYFVLLYFQANFGWMFYKEVLNDLLFSILSALIILRASTNGFTGIGRYLLENKFAVYCGKISYGLYILHLFIPFFAHYILVFFKIEILNKYLLFSFYFIISFIVASISWSFFERPINKLKRKYPYIEES